jgi:hypothetical protein
MIVVAIFQGRNEPQSEILNRQGAKNAKLKWLIRKKRTTLLKTP